MKMKGIALIFGLVGAGVAVNMMRKRAVAAPAPAPSAGAAPVQAVKGPELTQGIYGPIFLPLMDGLGGYGRTGPMWNSRAMVARRY